MSQSDLNMSNNSSLRRQFDNMELVSLTESPLQRQTHLTSNNQVLETNYIQNQDSMFDYDSEEENGANLDALQQQPKSAFKVQKRNVQSVRFVDEDDSDLGLFQMKGTGKSVNTVLSGRGYDRSSYASKYSSDYQEKFCEAGRFTEDEHNRAAEHDTKRVSPVPPPGVFWQVGEVLYNIYRNRYLDEDRAAEYNQMPGAKSILIKNPRSGLMYDPIDDKIVRNLAKMYRAFCIFCFGFGHSAYKCPSQLIIKSYHHDADGVAKPFLNMMLSTSTRVNAMGVLAQQPNVSTWPHVLMICAAIRYHQEDSAIQALLGKLKPRSVQVCQACGGFGHSLKNLVTRKSKNYAVSTVFQEKVRGKLKRRYFKKEDFFRFAFADQQKEIEELAPFERKTTISQIKLECPTYTQLMSEVKISPVQFANVVNEVFGEPVMDQKSIHTTYTKDLTDMMVKVLKQDDPFEAALALKPEPTIEMRSELDEGDLDFKVDWVSTQRVTTEKALMTKIQEVDKDESVVFDTHIVSFLLKEAVLPKKIKGQGSDPGIFCEFKYIRGYIVKEDLEMFGDKHSCLSFPNTIRIALDQKDGKLVFPQPKTLEKEIRSFIYELLGRNFFVSVPRKGKSFQAIGEDITSLGNFILAIPVSLWKYFFKNTHGAYRFFVLYYWVRNYNVTGVFQLQINFEELDPSGQIEKVYSQDLKSLGFERIKNPPYPSAVRPSLIHNGRQAQFKMYGNICILLNSSVSLGVENTKNATTLDPFIFTEGVLAESNSTQIEIGKVTVDWPAFVFAPLSIQQKWAEYAKAEEQKSAQGLKIAEPIIKKFDISLIQIFEDQKQAEQREEERRREFAQEEQKQAKTKKRVAKEKQSKEIESVVQTRRRIREGIQAPAIQIGQTASKGNSGQKPGGKQKTASTLLQSDDQTGEKME